MPHIHEEIDFAVEVFIVNSGAVLLRKHDKYKFWLSVGGHIELNEDPTQAAIREVKEEVDLDIELVGNVQNLSEGDDGYRQLLPPQFMNIHNINDEHKHVSLVYFGKSPSRIIKQGDVEISKDIHWFTKEDLEDPKWELRETIKHHALEALNLIKD